MQATISQGGTILRENMKGEQAVELFNIVKANNLLPETVDALVPLSFIGQAAVSFYRAKLKAMEQLQMTEEQRKATLRDGQDAGELLLDIEARIGQLLPSREEAMRTVVKDRSDHGKFKNNERKLPEGITSYRAQTSRKISEHPDVVEKVKRQAREKEEIATKTAVLNAISAETQKTRKVIEAQKIATLPIEQKLYIGQLELFLAALITESKGIYDLPEHWGGEALVSAQKVAARIIRKLDEIKLALEVFNEQRPELQ
jgi:hypothetical protein